MDYLSCGAMELMQREIWDKYPGIVATVGGHELVKKMRGKIPESLSREERIAIVEQFWKHDIYYTSKLIKSKVLVVGLLNDLSRFDANQYQKLAADIALAREKGYIILLFAHEPLATRNPAHKHITGEDAIQVGDASAFPGNYCDGCIAGGSTSDEATKAMYQLITNNADVIKGFFAGHVHSHMYLEIAAKLPDGTIAGAATNLFQGMRNAMAFGIPEGDAVRVATWNPACAIGAQDRIGSIEEGKQADFLVCAPDYSSVQVYMAGKPL